MEEICCNDYITHVLNFEDELKISSFNIGGTIKK